MDSPFFDPDTKEAVVDEIRAPVEQAFEHAVGEMLDRYTGTIGWTATAGRRTVATPAGVDVEAGQLA